MNSAMSQIAALDIATSVLVAAYQLWGTSNAASYAALGIGGYCLLLLCVPFCWRFVCKPLVRVGCFALRQGSLRQSDVGMKDVVDDPPLHPVTHPAFRGRLPQSVAESDVESAPL